LCDPKIRPLRLSHPGLRRTKSLLPTLCTEGLGITLSSTRERTRQRPNHWLDTPQHVHDWLPHIYRIRSSNCNVLRFILFGEQHLCSVVMIAPITLSTTVLVPSQICVIPTAILSQSQLLAGTYTTNNCPLPDSQYHPQSLHSFVYSRFQYWDDGLTTRLPVRAIANHTCSSCHMYLIERLDCLGRHHMLQVLCTRLEKLKYRSSVHSHAWNWTNAERR